MLSMMLCAQYQINELIHGQLVSMYGYCLCLNLLSQCITMHIFWALANLACMLADAMLGHVYLIQWICSVICQFSWRIKWEAAQGIRASDR